MRKALSLTELLVTLAIVAVVVGVVFVSYNGLRNRSVNLVSEDVQRNFLRALDLFSSSGGNLATILNNGALTETDKGHAMLAALQESASAARRNQTGQVGDLVPDNAKVIASVEDGSPRLVPTAGGVNLATAGTGFVITLDASTPAVARNDDSAVTTAATNAVSGVNLSSLYANNQQYLWDTDTAAIAGPTTPAISTGVTTTTVTGAEIVIAYGAYINGAATPSTPSFNYAEYTNAGTYIEVFAYRRDGAPLNAADVAFSVTFPDATDTYTSVGGAAAAARTVNGTAISSTGTLVQGLLVSFRPNTHKPATSWGAPGYALRANATGTVASGLGATNSARNVGARRVALNPPSIARADGGGDPNVIDDPADTVTVNSAATNPGIPTTIIASSVTSNGGLNVVSNTNGVAELRLP